MNAFETYGETAAPKVPDNRANRRKKAPSKLDLKMEEKQRLTKAYKSLRRQLRIEILQREPRLKDLIRYLRKVGPEDGDDLIEAVAACQWLMTADQEVRLFALNLVARREDKIKLSLGLLPLDDPLPPETCVFFEVQRLLRMGGAL
jgi:hypothetical protein